ncbi:MAG: tRNA-dihydrouridine synthase, partial [Candidatus Firestonebacteria bacterium]
PLTVKIRSGWDASSINAVEIALAAEASGADAVTLHPRLRTQGFTGVSDWALIGKVKKAVKIPVIGSGDIKTGGDAERMFKETGCDAVMIGRACLGNPWIFKEVLHYLNYGSEMPEVTLKEKLELVRKHGILMVKYKGEKRGLREYRKQLHYYLKGVKGAKGVRAQINKMESLEELNTIIDSVER